jgi:hypothetical protein
MSLGGRSETYDRKARVVCPACCAHVADLERRESSPLDIDANTPPFTNHHVAMHIGPVEHRRAEGGHCNRLFILKAPATSPR